MRTNDFRDSPWFFAYCVDVVVTTFAVAFVLDGSRPATVRLVVAVTYFGAHALVLAWVLMRRRRNRHQAKHAGRI